MSSSKGAPSWRKPRSFTALLPVEADADGLARALARRGDDVDSTGLDRTSALLLLRIQVLAKDDVARKPARALFSMVHDGPLDEALADLFRCTDGWLPQLLERHCAPGKTADRMRAWLAAQAVAEDTVYLGFPGLSVAQVRSEARLREAVQDFLDVGVADGRWSGASPDAIRSEVRRHVLGLGDPSLPSGVRPPVPLEARLLKAADLVWQVVSPLSGLLRGEIRSWLLPPGKQVSLPRRAGSEVLLALHWLWTVLPCQAFLALVRWLERTERDATVRVSAERIDELERREDHQVHNPMTMFSKLRPRALRRFALRRVLKGAEGASRHLWNEGRLAGIETIHAARILQIDEGRRMLFLSDYDGSWSRYLADFLGPGRVAVVPIWTHLLGCPRTIGMFEPTPGFEAPFLAFTRHDQLPVQLWYSAFPKLSLRNIRANARLRDGLFAPEPSAEEQRAWLQEL